MVDRYIPVGRLEGDARWRPFPNGHCQWCGKELPRAYKSYCPGEKIETYAGSGRFYSWQRCRYNFWNYWYTTPRFRRLILLRDNFTCQQCGSSPTVTWEDGIKRPNLHELHVDHIHPLARGGANGFENLQLLCASCNLHKGASLPD